jgi:IS5 family transposase
MGQMSFFDADDRLKSLSRLGDPLEPLNELIPWADFRPLLSQVREKARKSAAGRKPFDVVFMFKVLVLQSLYNLGDEQLEFQIRDRLSFMRFLGLGVEDRVPDATTVWRFREDLKEQNLMERLFHRFGDYLGREGLQARSGQIIDASIVRAPVQRNSREENQRIKRGDVPEDWNDAKREQKDVEARWTKKHGKSYYGYKNHINVDAEHKFVRDYQVTPANVHDSQVFDDVIDSDNADPEVWADSAYRSEETQAMLEKAGYVSHIQEKGQAGQPLSDEQNRANRERSRIRSRVEHVFGVQENSLGGKRVRTIGLARAVVKIGLMNLSYTFKRYAYLSRRGASAPVAG